MTGKRVVLQRFYEGPYTYIQCAIPCRHEKCVKCPHGAYWYVEFYRGKKKERFYIGKRLMLIRWEAEAAREITIDELYKRRKLRAQKQIAKDNEEEIGGLLSKP